MFSKGFENVVAQKFRVPIGPWAKDPDLVSWKPVITIKTA